MTRLREPGDSLRLRRPYLRAVTRVDIARSVIIGLVAGVASGMFGVGGGIVMVPLAVLWLAFDQHSAHATSLAAIVPIAFAGAVTFALNDEMDFGLAALLAAGALVGAPIGARLMARTAERSLKIAFGVLTIAVGVLVVVS